MRNYGKVAPAFWKRGSGKRLRGKPEAQVLALYLMTCEQGTMCGLFYTSLSVIVSDTGLTEKQAREALALLARENLAHFDEGEELVFVPGTPAHQVGPELKPGDKRRVAILSEVQKIGAHRFVADFWSRYSDAYRLGPMPASMRGADAPSDAPSHAPSDGAEEDHPMPLRSQHYNNTTTSSDGTEDAPSSEPKTETRRRGGRAARTLMREGWQPKPEDREAVVAAQLDADAIVADFVNYWLAEGKPMANWDAAFRNNVSRIQRTEGLRRKYAQAMPVPSPSPSQANGAGPKHGPAVPPPPGMLDRMRRFARGEADHLESPPPAGGSEPPPAAEGGAA